MNLKREIVGNKHFGKSKTTAHEDENSTGGGGEDLTVQPFSFHFLSSHIILGYGTSEKGKMSATTR